MFNPLLTITFVLGFYLKISVHLRLSVVEKEFSNSL